MLGASSVLALAAVERFVSREQRRHFHRGIASERASPSLASVGASARASSAKEIPMNTQRTSVLLALRAARPWYEGSWPKTQEVDAIVRRARKALVEQRNALTRAPSGEGSAAHPTITVAVFDQVSHALSRFAVPSANGAAIVRELGHNVTRATQALSVDPSVRALATRSLLEDAAVTLVDISAQTESDPAAAQWLLNVASELVRHESVAHNDAPSHSVKPSNNMHSKKVEAPVVNKNSPLIDTLKTDATDAAWRTAGSQFVKLTREPLVGLLTRHLAPGDDAFRAKMAAFLETELGGAIVASLLAAALSALPTTTGEVPQKLARELRVRAMSDAGDVLADLLMGPLRQVIALYLQDPAGAPAQPAMGALPEGSHETFDDSSVRERVGAAR